MKCTECPEFKIICEPANYTGMKMEGLVICEKHGLSCDYVSKQQISRLECIEDSEVEL